MTVISDLKPKRCSRSSVSVDEGVDSGRGGCYSAWGKRRAGGPRQTQPQPPVWWSSARSTVLSAGPASSGACWRPGGQAWIPQRTSPGLAGRVREEGLEAAGLQDGEALPPGILLRFQKQSNGPGRVLLEARACFPRSTPVGWFPLPGMFQGLDPGTLRGLPPPPQSKSVLE